jgi:Uma2 family endonuclease
MLTAAEFAARRYELPDGGRWTELIAGELRTLHPPDQKHGDVVLNLSKAVANALRPTSDTYAGFELGIQTRQNPDTIRFPAMSVFTSGDHFALADAVYVTRIPALVVEVVSTNDRRTSIAERIYEYHSLGVDKVWVVDPHGQAVTILRRGAKPLTFSGNERVTDLALLPGFEIPVQELFAEPAWWRGKR